MLCISAPCKFVLCGLNLLIALAGIIVVVLTSLAYLAISMFYEVNSKTFVICLIVIACFLVVIPCMGCIGAFTGLGILLKIYAAILIVLALIQLAITITLYVKLSNDKIDKMVNDNFEKYWTDANVRMALDQVQKRMECCGTTGPEFFDGKPMPDACCQGLKVSEKCTKAKAVQNGCLETAVDGVKSVLSGAKIVCLVTFLIECVCIVLACLIAKL